MDSKKPDLMLMLDPERGAFIHIDSLIEWLEHGAKSAPEGVSQLYKSFVIVLSQMKARALTNPTEVVDQDGNPVGFS